MSEFYFAEGIVRYKDDGWVIIEAPRSVVHYYAKWVEKFIWKKVSNSYHGAHISVVAGKHEKNCKTHMNWKKFDGKKIKFKYYSTIYTDHKAEYFWLVVECPLIAEIRTSLGLNPFLKWKSHLTVAFRGY